MARVIANAIRRDSTESYTEDIREIRDHDSGNSYNGSDDSGLLYLAELLFKARFGLDLILNLSLPIQSSGLTVRV